ncbi:MAG: T9SS type A sorting domain-containing protein [Bacteroidetes bacterium]|nr:T9SS type A sorting domain-containing protein [Bacteroidota bacterium]
MKKIFTIFTVVMIFSIDLFSQTGDIFPLIPGRKLSYAGWVRDKTTDSNLAAPITKKYTVLDSGFTFTYVAALRGLRYAKPTHFIWDSTRIITGATTYLDTLVILPIKRATNISGSVYLLRDMTSTFAAIGHTSVFPYIWIQLWKEGVTAPTTWLAFDSTFAGALGSVPIKITATLSAAENFTSSVGGTHQVYKVEFKATAPTVAARNTYTLWVAPKFGIVKIIIHGDGTNNGQIGTLVGAVTNVPLRKELIADKFELTQNYPNPFNPSTTIKFNLPEKSLVNVKIFDVLGKEITTLVKSTLETGKYEIPFVANGLTSGIYFYQINAEGLTSNKKFTQTNKMILNK